MLENTNTLSDILDGKPSGSVPLSHNNQPEFVQAGTGVHDLL
jgi:hypothetical protein